MIKLVADIFIYLYRKCSRFICKYVSYSWPNGWTKLSEVFSKPMGTLELSHCKLDRLRK